MAGFSSRSDLIQAIRDKGQFNEFQFRKANAAGGAGSAGFPQEYFTSTGTPGAISISSTAGAAVALDNTTSGALTSLPEGNVSTAQRYLLNAQFTTTATNFAPGIVVLCDLLLYYPSLSGATATTLDNTVTLPRYTNGQGVMAVAFQRAAVSTSAQVTLTYNADDGSSQSGLTLIPNASRITQFYRSTVASTFPVIFQDLPNGKIGIKSVTSYTTNAGGASGDFDIVLLKPLAIIPIQTGSIPTEVDFASQFLSLPRIYDGACLGFFVIPGGNLSNSAVITGRIQYGWN